MCRGEEKLKKWSKTRIFKKNPELNQKKQHRARDCAALPIDWQLINVTECRATGHGRLQRRIDTAEGGTEFSFPTQASPPQPQPLAPPPPFAFRAQRVQRAEQIAD